MKHLSEAVPKDLFEQTFGTVREKVLATNLQELEVARAKDIPGICMFVWDEMVHRGVVKKPQKIAPIVNNDFEGVYRFVKRQLGRDPVSDAYAVSYYNELDDGYSFADATIVQCYPNDLHIADVEFADNRKPISNGSVRKGRRSYHGLHVFGEFIDRLKQVAKSRDVGRLSLMVGDADLYPVFSRHGFKVNETEMAQVAYKQFGVGYPMILKVGS